MTREGFAEGLTAAGLGLDYDELAFGRTTEAWVRVGDRLRAQVAERLDGVVAGVEQVGSSSVLGLLAKPIVDLAVGQGPEHDIGAIAARLEAGGWTYRGDAGASGGHVFVLEARPWHRVAHLHVVDHGGRQWTDYLRFRELLRGSPEARARYEAVKVQLADECRGDREGYQARKSDVVESLLQLGSEHQQAPTGVAIRAARPEDGPDLQQIERLAGEQFREVGLPEVADDEPMSVDALAAYAEQGRSWVAVDDTGAPIGYVLVDVVDGAAHVEQVSVRPDRQGAGVGRALLDRVRAWAGESGLPAVTLTTFADIPWNALLYRYLGFRVLAEHEIGPQLRAVRADEAAHGLAPERRVCMRLELDG